MDTKSFHLGRQPAPEGILKGVCPEGEFHESSQSASQVLLAGVAQTREIHLKTQCASECLLAGVGPKGEFHENACNDAETTQAASEALLAGVTRNDAETAQAFGQDMGAAMRQKAMSANLAEMLDKLGTNQVVVILRIRSIQLAAIVGY